jgi:hypothetical protein
MTFFQSEEHLKKWSGFVAGTEEGMIPLHDLMKLFSGKLFRRRLDKGYLSKMRSYMLEFGQALYEIGKTGEFWQIKRPDKAAKEN